MGGLGSVPLGNEPLGGELSGSYSYITLAEAIAALAIRLDDPGQVFYQHKELGLYIVEALRTYNALTAKWVADFIFVITGPVSSVWVDLSQQANYPRQRTVMDSDIYTVMQYHLLEPATGGTWTGSSQFSIADFSQALQRRRDEILLATGTGVTDYLIAAPPNVRQVELPESILDLRRMRWVPALGDPITLFRDDTLAFQIYTPGYVQGNAGDQQTPGILAYSVVDSSPLTLTLDFPPNQAGQFDILNVKAGNVFDPPESTLVGIPDDWSWVLKWGALADVLGGESEAHDELRAQYARQRYEDGMKAMMAAPWILLAQIDNVPVDTPSFVEMDSFAPEWDSDTSETPSVVVGGVDFVAPIPAPLSSVGLGNKPLGDEPLGGFGFSQMSVQVTVVKNAPVPATDLGVLQVAKDTLDVILDYAQHLAAFKQGGQEFTDSIGLAKTFVKAAIRENSRLDKLGIFRDVLLGEFERAETAAPRYSRTQDNG